MLHPLSAIESFIEIGPGEGKRSQLLCEQGLKGVGIDFSPYVAEKLKERMDPFIRAGQYRVIEADIMQSLPEARADLVFCMMVLEHIEDDRAFLERAKQMVRPGGGDYW
jgi:2-polyprenyl-3-methyl-5-hydroxy-6-metoxy-1,4-benzoquinol methylase